jgi:hypothetical protein
MAVGHDRNALSYSQFGWGEPQKIDSSPLEEVSCPSPTFCVATDAAGDVLLYELPPANTAPPVTSGTAQVGSPLIASTGSWTNAPASFTYQWMDCDGGGAGCTSIGGASASSYVPTAGDASHTIEVAVTAINAVGGSAPAISASTAVVPQVAPQPVAAAHVVGATQVVDAAKANAALAAIPLPTGKGAKVAQLLKHGDFAAGFNAPSAGTLTIDWYAKPKANTKATRKIKAVKKILIAQGKITVTAPGATQVKVSFTKLGAKLLTSSKAVKVTDESTFTPIGGPPTTLTSTFTLKR